MGETIWVGKWIPPGVVTTGLGVINVSPPQTGKTYRTSRDFMESARRGDTLVYAVSSHAEACSIIKHFVQVQREYNWELRCLLIVYAGLNRWCPLYREIVKERKRQGTNYSQNRFCLQNCELWRMKPIPKEILEPGSRACYINKYRSRRTGNCTIVHGPIRIILNNYDYKLLKKLYPDISSSVDFAHHTMVIQSGEESAKYGEPMFVSGCIRRFIMRKMIDVTKRDKKGRLKGKHRRTCYGYPTIIVIPHHLLPMVLHFARIYSARVFVVIDEFDRILTIKMPRWLAERYSKLPPPKKWLWKNVLEKFMLMVPADDKESYYITNVLFKLELKKEVDDNTGKKRVREVPLITMVSLELDKLKSDKKLVYLGIIGSSIPLLPRPLLEYLVGWVKRYFNDILLYYNYAGMPKHYNIPYVPNPVDMPPRTLIIYGSKEIAAQQVFSCLDVNNADIKIEFPNPTPNQDIDKVIDNICKKYGYEHRSGSFVCISKNRKKALIWKPILGLKGGEVIVRGLAATSWYIPRDYIKINNRYVTWLGSRLTRGVTLPRKVKYMVIATSGKAQVKVKTLAGEEIHDRVRTLDLLQVLFRINSRPDIVVVLTPNAQISLTYTIKWFNRHVKLLISLVTKEN